MTTDRESPISSRRQNGRDLALEAATELAVAITKFPGFNSSHEGYAVILEELDELWEHVKANNGRGDDARNEAIQVAAMALRYVHDLCGPKESVA